MTTRTNHLSLAAWHPVALTASAAVVTSALLCSAGRYVEAAALAAFALIFGLAATARTSIESLLTGWFFLTPLASFYLRLPVERSILTFDRVVFVVALATLYLNRRTGGERRTFSVSKFEIAWAMLAVVALVSAAAESSNPAYGLRIAIDSFWLPLIAFHLARHHFDLRGRGGALLLAAIALALFLFAVGAYEAATGTNLFQYKGSELVREGERRVNGPFASDSSFAIISLLVALFLRLLPRMLGLKLDAAARLVYWCALLSAIAASFLSLFRSVAVTLVICLIVTTPALFRKAKSPGPTAGSPARRSNARAASWATASALVLLSLMAWGAIAVLLSPGGRLESLHNLYGRVATWQAAAEIALDHPASGVGLANYNAYFNSHYNWEDRIAASVEDARPARNPHSNLLWIAAELGLFGFALYAMANVYIFLMGYRALKQSGSLGQRAAAACFLAIAIAYSIPGLTLTSGAYSDLNTYFFFMLGLTSNKFPASDS